jgi:ABC-type glycerol-3-phosphate transport system substrate-binding protein
MNSSFRVGSAAILSVLLATLSSCEFVEPKIAVLWTDRPEFAVYAELFNASQSRYKLEAFYREAPAQALVGAEEYPDLVVGSWLKSASTRALFRPLDYFFEELLLTETGFYPKLLALGNIDGKQYLLPVSFNIPALIFSRENASLIPSPFTLSLDEIRSLGKAHNVLTDGAFTRMGFSPRWNDEFLFVAASLFGTSFREGTPLAWDKGALEKAVTYLREWTSDANRDTTAEDDFEFKYLYDPPHKLASSGRILFAYITSADLFTVPEERRATLDFRWIAKDAAIPVAEGAAYLGVCKRGKARSAADAFVQWFYKEETQRRILERSKRLRLNESVFGIAGGFSALRAVNDDIYPLFYPGLLGHVPPAEYLSPPNILPKDWTNLKLRVVLPYLHDRVRVDEASKVQSLENRISEWYRLNPPR